MELQLQDITINDVFERAITRYPKSEAVVCGRISVTYEELHRRTERIADRLLQAGVQDSDVVAMVMGTDLDAVSMFYGLLKIGAIAVPLNPELTEEELSGMLETADPAFLVYGSSVKHKKLKGRWKLLPLDTGSEEIQDPVRLQQVKEHVDGKAPAVLIFTSGTTSCPKAVPLTQFGLLNSAVNLGRQIRVSETDRFCGALPIFHSFCISVTMLIPLLFGACTCFVEDRHSYTVMRTIERERCTVLSGVPTMFHSIVQKPDLNRYDLSSLRIGFIGGAYCPPEQFKLIEKRLNMTLIPTLGQTESTGGFTVASPEDSQELRSCCVGRPMNGMEVSVQSQEGVLLKPGEHGEICVRGYLVMPGYWRDLKKTRAVISEDGWLHTGDLGWMDEKQCLFLIGRMKNIIIRSGENISPSEIESVILEDDRIVDCKVIGIPDPHYGEEICACILPLSGTLVDVEEIRRRISRRLPDFKVPRYLLLFDTFPRTGLGKVRTEMIKETAYQRIKEVIK